MVHERNARPIFTGVYYTSIFISVIGEYSISPSKRIRRVSFTFRNHFDSFDTSLIHTHENTILK